MASSAPAVPSVPGVLSAAEVAATGRSIAEMQEPSGAIPWTVGQHADIWNHVEAAMALSVCRLIAEAERAYDWCVRTQRADGSWPLKTVGGVVEDPTGETNMSAYLAVGVWHHWLITGDHGFVRRLWPTVRAGLDFVVAMQLPFGGIAWAQEWRDDRPGYVHQEALLAGSSSIYQALRAGVGIAELIGESVPRWHEAGCRLGHALREHRDLFLDKATFSMDWYYPILGGAVRGEAAHSLIKTRWDDFVVQGLGIRCVDTNPWVTGAETCELVLALDAIEDDRASVLFADMQHLRLDDGRYWTGFVFGADVNWPDEQTTYTAAAVVLAADALGRGTPGSGIMRGDVLPELVEERPMAQWCTVDECRSADVVARVSGDA